MKMVNASLQEAILRQCRERIPSVESYGEEDGETVDIEMGEFEGTEEDLPYEEILADKRREYSDKEEFIYLLHNDALKYFVKNWEGTVLRKKYKKEYDDDFLEEFDKDESTDNVGSNETLIESKENESYLNDDSDTASKLPWKIILPDEFANITFINDNTYTGRISRKMMEGKGVYRWSHGAQYKGEFERNRMHGSGLLEWNSTCWYEGDFANGYLHGRGLLVNSDKRFMYTGQWFEGHKHGSGYYRCETQGSYDGDWVMDKWCGFGLRIYPSGARYVGQWKNGVRDGVGTIVWANGDVYRGEWKNGEMNGYGVYVWNAFFNKSFTWLQESSYTGFWQNGLRSGEGKLTLNTVGGAKYFGSWKNNKKHGHGTIIGNNGEKLEADPLFLDDILVPTDNGNVISQDQSATNEANQCVRAPKEDKPVFVDAPSELRITPVTPVLKPEQFPSLSYYLTRLLNLKSPEDPLIRSISSGKCYTCENQSCSCLARSSSDIITGEENIDAKLEEDNVLAYEREYEERWMYNCLTIHMFRLRQIYANAAKVFAPLTIGYKLVMSRMCLWQFWRDCKINEKGLSLIEIDNYIATNESTIVNNPHDPFEKIEIWQFLHALIEVSWHLYTKQNNIETPDMNGKLASGFHTFLRNDVYPHVGNHVDSLCREHLNLLPVKAVFKMYQSIRYPCSVKDLLRATCCLEGTQYSKSSFMGDKMATQLPDGINAVTIGEHMRYLIEDKEIFSSPAQESNTSKYHEVDGLLIFRDLRATKMLEIISLICVGVKDPDSGIIVNIDYELTFLEFYEIILEATKQLLFMRKKAGMLRRNNTDET